MSHADVLAAIVARGGRLVASFTLDADGRTEGERSTHNRKATCSVCGEKGHTSRHPRHRPLTEADVIAALDAGAAERKAAERTLKRSPRR